MRERIPSDEDVARIGGVLRACLDSARRRRFFSAFPRLRIPDYPGGPSRRPVAAQFQASRRIPDNSGCSRLSIRPAIIPSPYGRSIAGAVTHGRRAGADHGPLPAPPEKPFNRRMRCLPNIVRAPEARASRPRRAAPPPEPHPAIPAIADPPALPERAPRRRAAPPGSPGMAAPRTSRPPRAKRAAPPPPEPHPAIPAMADPPVLPERAPRRRAAPPGSPGMAAPRASRPPHAKRGAIRRRGPRPVPQFPEADSRPSRNGAVSAIGDCAGGACAL